MSASTTNGGGPVEPRHSLGDHAQGRAALLLVESLMHALVAKGALSREDFIDVVEGAGEVEQELLISNGAYPAHRNGLLLPPLAAAFKKELGR